MTLVCMQDDVLLCEECTAHKGHDVLPLAGAALADQHTLRDLGCKLKSGAQEALASIASLQDCRERMVKRATQSFATFERDVQALHAAVDTHARSSLAAAQRELKQHLKSIDAQVDALTVTANQLACVARMCSRAAFDGSAATVHAHRSALRALPLIKPYTGPCVSSIVELRSRFEELALALPAHTQLHTAADVKRSSVTGAGTRSFQCDTENVIDVVVRDSGGSVVQGLHEHDLVVSLRAVAPDCGPPDAPAATAAELATCVARVTAVRKRGDGEFAVTYVVHGEPTSVLLSLSACGTPLTRAAPWAIRPYVAGCLALGVPVGSITVSSSTKFGMAVSPDQAWLAVAMYGDSKVMVYSLTHDGGTFSHEFGVRGNAPGQLSSPCKMCFSLDGTLLVTEHGSNRVQEFTIQGEFVRVVAACERAVGIDCNDSVMVVSNFRSIGMGVETFDLRTGKLLAAFASIGTGDTQVVGHCEGVRLTRDGRHVVVTENHSRMSLFTLDGEFVKRIGDGLITSGNNDVALTAQGDYIVCEYDSHRVSVFNASTDELERRWELEASVKPIALAVAGGRLYVLDYSGGVVHVFE